MLLKLLHNWILINWYYFLKKSQRDFHPRATPWIAKPVPWRKRPQHDSNPVVIICLDYQLLDMVPSDYLYVAEMVIIWIYSFNVHKYIMVILTCNNISFSLGFDFFFSSVDTYFRSCIISLALYMVIRLVVAAGIIIIGVRDGRLFWLLTGNNLAWAVDSNSLGRPEMLKIQ